MTLPDPSPSVAAPSRVLVVSDMYAKDGWGGAGESIHRQVAALRAEGVDPTVIRPRARLHRNFGSSGGFAAMPSRVDDGTLVIDAPHWNLPVRLAAGATATLVTRAVRQAMKRESPAPIGVIHAYRLYPNGIAATALARQLGVPVVVTALGSDVHTHPRRLPKVGALVRQVLREADRLVAVSEDLAAQMTELAAPRHPVEVVYNGVDEGRFFPASDVSSSRRSLGLPEAGVGVCFLGRLVPTKGLPELMAAYGRVAPSAVGQSWLAVIGDGPMAPEVAAWAAGTEQRVIAPGAVPHAEVATWLRASDILVLPSHNEGLPNVILEAMACGLAVLATSVGGIPEAVIDGETGLLCPVGDVDALARGLTELIVDEPRRKAMGERATSRARSQFGWKRSAEALVRLYGQITGGSTRVNRGDA
jgi:glycosyltransferase involved in cell wall biosynthesis